MSTENTTAVASAFADRIADLLIKRHVATDSPAALSICDAYVAVIRKIDADIADVLAAKLPKFMDELEAEYAQMVAGRDDWEYEDTRSERYSACIGADEIATGFATVVADWWL